MSTSTCAQSHWPTLAVNWGLYSVVVRSVKKRSVAQRASRWAPACLTLGHTAPQFTMKSSLLDSRRQRARTDDGDYLRSPCAGVTFENSGPVRVCETLISVI